MLNPDAKDFIESSDPDVDVVLILSWPVASRPDKLSQVDDRRERRRLLDEYYVTLKKPVLQEVEQQDGAAITDSLDGTNRAIVTAPAKVWRRMIRRENSALLSDSVFVACSTIGGFAHGRRF
jgi:hypothetical protein